VPGYDAGALSPIQSLSRAWDASVRLLFRPFIRRRWIELSIVCLFLGGGTSTAAFRWGYGVLRIDLDTEEVFYRIRQAIAQHWSLSVLTMVVSVAAVLGFLYARCVFRFILVNAVIKQEVAIREAWNNSIALGFSYFAWLLGAVGALLAMVIGAAVVSLRYLGLIRETGHPEWLASLLLITDLAAVVCIGSLAAIVLTLTDDLATPLMYAEKISLPAAWQMIWKISRRDSGTFLVYFALRFALGLGISIAVLVILFPVLMGLSSLAFLGAALVVLALRAVGLAWVWNPATTFLAAAALCILSALLFALLSVMGMPGQVYLQNYGVRFISSRVPSLEALCRAAEPPRHWR
jgi:hypothetical protein